MGTDTYIFFIQQYLYSYFKNINNNNQAEQTVVRVCTEFVGLQQRN